MRVADYLVSDLHETLARQRRQVFDVVPAQRRLERFPESNSISWAAFHTARHAALALHVLGRPSSVVDDVSGLAEIAFERGNGLQEVQQAWFGEPDPDAVADYNAAVFADVRAYLAGLDDAELDRVPDAASALDGAGISREDFGWLHAQWTGQPVAFLVRWPLTAHLVHHVGEMITYRNQMGLSPFR